MSEQIAFRMNLFDGFAEEYEKRHDEIFPELAQALKDAGAAKVKAYITHPVLSGPAIERISNSSIDELVVTNSISLSTEAEKCSKIRVISLAPTIAECIRRLNNEESLSALFL